MTLLGPVFAVALLAGSTSSGSAAGEARSDELESRRARVHETRVRVVGPVPGAVVWGRIAVGAEVELGAEGDRAADVWLECSGGERLDPVREVRSTDRVRRLVFELDTTTEAPGPTDLVAVIARREGGALRSAPVRVRVVHPGADDVFRGECEDLAALPRPDGFGDTAPRLGSRPDASEGAFVVSSSARPMFAFPFEVAEPGRFQMMVVARGDLSAGAFPSIGFAVDGLNDSRTAARLVDRTWHRLPLGFPIDLESGTRGLAVSFLNDFYLANTADRNLYIDRVELLRVEEEGPAAGYGAMAMMAAMSSMRAGGSKGGGAEHEGIRIGLRRPIDGLPVAGRVQFDAVCRWDGMETGPAPWVELVLNGRPVASQQASRPRFALDRGAFAAGPNTVQLRATHPDGRRGATPLETVVVGAEPRPAQPPRDAHRFAVVDERWDDLRALFTGEGEEQGHVVASLPIGGGARLELPDYLAGEFDVLVEARGPSAPLAAVIDVELETDGGATSVGSARVQNWWNFPAAGSVQLERGPKALTIVRAGSATSDDAAELALVRSVILRSRRAGPDRGAPHARVLYPPAGHVTHGVDVVVVEAWDDEDRLATADLYIDGVAQRTHARVPDGLGWVVLPAILRGMSPGEHVLSVRVEDPHGNLGESLEVPFVIAAERPEQLGRYARAVRLLSRFAYGPESDQLAALLLEGERPWLERQLAARGASDLSAHALALAEMRDVYEYAVTRAALQHAIATGNPTWARATWWIENHFSTWIRKSGGGPEWGEHEMYLHLGPTSFDELLTASATSPAMITYLDQRQSYAGGLNENYARELLELHTVGVDGGYGQHDVTELAGLLAGTTLVEQAPYSGAGGLMAREFRYVPELGDGRAFDVLGHHFEEAGVEDRRARLESALAMLAVHPQTASFVSRKLAEHYVSTPAPERLVEELSRVFVATGGDLRSLLLTIAASEELFAPDLAPRVMSPMDYGLRIARVTANPAAHWALHSYLNRTGMACFDRPTPDGFPEEDAAWSGTNATIQRWAFPGQIHWAVGSIVPRELRAGSGGDVEAWRQRVVDIVAMRMTGDVLGESSNRAVLEFFAALDGKPWDQVGRVAVLVCQMPEAGTR